MFRVVTPKALCAHKILRTSTTKKLWTIRQEMLARAALLTSPPPTEASGLLPKTCADSAIDITIPFQTDKEVRAEYVNAVGHLRFGKLLEDLDAFACTIAHTHADDLNAATGPASIVTGSVERIDMLSHLNIDHDLSIRGNVVWVGSSSMLVQCTLTDLATKLDVLVANFMLVTVDETGKPIRCNPLTVRTPEENAMFAAAERSNEKRREVRKKLKRSSSRLIYDLQHLVMSEETIEIMKQKLKKEQARGAGSGGGGGGVVPSFADADAISPPPVPAPVRMKDTVQVATHLTQPQDANQSQKVFGGFLLQKAFEIAWVAAYIHMQSKPLFLCLDDVSFLYPVKLGSICVFTATVCFVKNEKLVQVHVDAEIVDPISGDKKTTNSFELIFVPTGEAEHQQQRVRDVKCECVEDWINYARGKAMVDETARVAKENKLLRINKFLK